eukprot:TRINITY_DN3458_c0_g2_i2.p1 TRINITY_DN3458_c0_g2~~TRINITY_DN3458_c0_g2_i2.p1  ORF type:complete len:812 (-),score=233.61 TRINITY_DN3458_c0_g2_i2:41-2476(-)
MDDSQYQIRLGNLFTAQIQLRELLSKYEVPLKAKAVAYYNLGLVASKKEKWADAIKSLQESFAYESGFADAHALLAFCYNAKANKISRSNHRLAVQYLHDAVEQQQKVVTLRPQDPDARLRLASYMLNLPNNAIEATKIMREVVKEMPDNPIAFYELARAQEDIGALIQARQSLTKAIKLNPDVAVFHSQLGIVFMKMGKFNLAVNKFQSAIKLINASKTQEMAKVYGHLGKSHERLKNYELAMRLLAKAIELDPSHGQAHFELGQLQLASNQFQAAVTSFHNAYNIDNLNHDSFCYLMFAKRKLADWSNWDQHMDHLTNLLNAQLDADRLPCLLPLHLLHFNLTHELQVRATRRIASELFRRTSTGVRNIRNELSSHAANERRKIKGIDCDSEYNQMHESCSWNPPARSLPRGSDGKIRIGYMSSNFQTHAVGVLIQAMFGEHNRDRFHITCYSLGPPNRDDKIRERIRNEADTFIDISRKSIYDAAARIRADNIHILVNLNGHTMHSRNEIFALHPAPVQLMFNGFYFTFGGAGIDYLVTDKLATPPTMSQMYNEQFVYLPVPFTVSDYMFTHAEMFAAKRQGNFVFKENGVQKSKIQIGDGNIVFASFNDLFKLEPRVFAVWMNILKRVPRSILWLQRSSAQIPAKTLDNIRSSAKAQGVDPKRIIFTDRLSRDQHLVVKALADVFLDNPLFNAHTSGIDALFAGVPMVTLAGETMSQRIGASMLQGLGLSCLITHNLREYEDLAVKLATNGTYLQFIRQHLRQQRTESSLFNTSNWLKSYEKAMGLLWESFAARNNKRFHIIVADGQ